MTCQDCAQSAETALKALPGVSAQVSLATSSATIRSSGATSAPDMISALKDLGYDATLDRSHRLHIAIIGSGSGAFAAAITATEGGTSVTMIESGDVIGGTCVNIGCVPSKILIAGAHIAHAQGTHAFEGIAPQRPAINRQAMVRQQQQWVRSLRDAKYESILDTNPDIELVRGHARFTGTHTLAVDKTDGSEASIEADQILIATGARPHVPDIAGLGDTPYWTSNDALVAETLPDTLVVLGGSVVALELAQAFLHLGVSVTLLARSTLLSREDTDIGQSLVEILKDEGMDVRLHIVPKAIRHNGDQFEIDLEGDTLHADQLLVATGRVPNTTDLGLSSVGVETVPGGDIVVDDHLRTSQPDIYAVGDCTTLPQYVYVAAAAGTRAGRNMTGGDSSLDLSILPAVVFTTPQVATVGLTEHQAKQSGHNTQVRTLSLEHVPRALANMDTRGFIKLVADADTEALLGCQIVADEAGEIIQSAALALRSQMTVGDLASELYPYLTMVEGLKLCAQTFSKDVSQLSCCAG